MLERFWLQPSLALCCVAGCGVGMIFQFLKEKANCPALKYLFLSLAVIAIGYQVLFLAIDIHVQDMFPFVSLDADDWNQSLAAVRIIASMLEKSLLSMFIF